MKYRIVVNSRSKLVSDTIIDILTELGCKAEILNLKLVNTKTMKESMTSRDIKFFTNTVKSNNFDLGVLIEDNSEKMMLVDNKGRVITEDMFIALISLIIFKSTQDVPMVVPISASHVVEKIADENKGKVIRTKTSPQDIMGNILGNDVKQEMLDQFTMHFDAIAGLVKILDFMKSNNLKLSQIVDMIPDFHMARKEVECPWNAKGKVIRQIIQENKGEAIETLEGVKIFQDNGWVLVLPDAESPVCKVISESYSAEFAEELTNIYADKIRKISRS